MNNSLEREMMILVVFGIAIALGFLVLFGKQNDRLRRIEMVQAKLVRLESLRFQYLDGIVRDGKQSARAFGFMELIEEEEKRK